MTPPAAMAEASAAVKPLSRAEEILRRFDKNHDGRLDEDEKADAHEAMLAEQMAKGVSPAVARNRDAFQALALELFDSNHDNRIDAEERLEAVAFIQEDESGVLRATLLQRFDRNHDGKLDLAERREAQAYAEEHRGELMQELLMKRYDTNADGQLEPEEKMAIREAFLNQPPPQIERAAMQKFVRDHLTTGRRGEILQRFDANGNGRLDREEQRSAQQYFETHREEGVREVLLEHFDKNGDGLLDPAERAAMRETLQAQATDAKESPALADLTTEVERRRAAREDKSAAQNNADKK